MYELYTEILINASPSTVWQVLTDFENYPEWNPFVRKVTGHVAKGSHIKIVLQATNTKPMTFKPIVLEIAEEKVFRWQGKLLIKGLFDGEHIWEIKRIDDKSIRFIQREKFTGILVPIFRKNLETNTRTGFKAMNEKLKELAEK